MLSSSWPANAAGIARSNRLQAMARDVPFLVLFMGGIRYRVNTFAGITVVAPPLPEFRATSLVFP
jgi:hypothetical protein